jgi:hypothetical protein
MSVAQGGARSSLALGYYLFVLTGLQSGSLRSHLSRTVYTRQLFVYRIEEPDAAQFQLTALRRGGSTSSHSKSPRLPIAHTRSPVEAGW